MNSRRERLCKKAGWPPGISRLSGDFCQLRRNRITANVRLQSSSVSDKAEANTRIGLKAALIKQPYSPLLTRSATWGSTVGLRINAEP